MPRVFINGVNLHYEEHGQGFPLLLLHGFAGATRIWQPQVEALSRVCRFVTYDMRGHGQSDVPHDASAYSVETVIEDQFQLLLQLGASRAVVGGLSMGGYLTLEYALRHPETVKGLIVIGAGPGFRNPERRQEWNDSRASLAETMERGGMEAFINSPEAASVHYSPPEVLRQMDPIGLANVCRYVMTEPNVVDRVPEIQAPALLLVGEKDEAFIRGIDYLEARLPNARKVVVPGARHGCNLDNPQVFNDAVLSFLKELGVAGGE